MEIFFLLVVAVIITFAALYFCYLSFVKSKLLVKSQERKCRPTTSSGVCQESVTFDPEARRSLALHTEQGRGGNGRCTPKARRQQRAGNLRESDDYWASNDSSGDSFSGEKDQAKKPRVKRCSTTRYGVTDSSDSNSSDNDSPHSEKQLLPITRTQDEKMGRDRSFEGNPISYSGDEKQKASDSEAAEPIEDHSPHDYQERFKYLHVVYVLELNNEITKLEKEIEALALLLLSKTKQKDKEKDKEREKENKKLENDILTAIGCILSWLSFVSRDV